MKALLAGALVCALPYLAMAQIAALQIKVVQGEGAVHQPGARVPHPLTVEVADENGKPVGGAAVSFQLPPEGASGLFSNGLRTDLVLTDAAGRATVPSMQMNRSAGQFRIRITAVKEQARAGTVASQSIAEGKGGAPVTTGATPAARSGEITPTTVKMSSGSHKKLYILAAIAVAGGAAFLGVSRATGSSSGSSPSSSVVSIGTPSITVGHP